MNYQIIKDETLLKKFIEWLPELKSNEIYYVCLFCRSKYCKDEKGNNLFPHIRTDKSQLKRFTSDKKFLFQKIKQLECEFGSYKYREVDVPQEALALYITVNPRSLEIAAKNSLIKLAQLVTKTYDGYNPHQEIMSEIQRAKSRTCYVDFDLDSKNDLISDLHIWIKESCGKTVDYKILESRGGFHLLINPDSVEEQYKKSWYNKLKKNPAIDQIGDMMIPVIGCTQGDFIPKFV